MVKRINRRMRCEVQGCHHVAEYGIGVKGLDYPMCSEHFEQFVREGMFILGLEQKVAEEITEVTGEETPVVAAEESIEVNKEEYFVCKYCGEKFSKKEMSVAQFAQHVKKCKKEHGE